MTRKARSNVQTQRLGVDMWLRLVSQMEELRGLKSQGETHSVDVPGGRLRKSGRWAFPGFPVDLVGVGELHAAFLNESRTRGRWWRTVAGNPGCPSFSAHVRFSERGAPVRLPLAWPGLFLGLCCGVFSSFSLRCLLLSL